MHRKRTARELPAVLCRFGAVLWAAFGDSLRRLRLQKGDQVRILPGALLSASGGILRIVGGATAWVRKCAAGRRRVPRVRMATAPVGSRLPRGDVRVERGRPRFGNGGLSVRQRGRQYRG